MAEEKKLPVPAPEAVPLHRPEVDAAPILPEPQTPPPPRRWALPRQRVHITG